MEYNFERLICDENYRELCTKECFDKIELFEKKLEIILSKERNTDVLIKCLLREKVILDNNLQELLDVENYNITLSKIQNHINLLKTKNTLNNWTKCSGSSMSFEEITNGLYYGMILIDYKENMLRFSVVINWTVLDYINPDLDYIIEVESGSTSLENTSIENAINNTKHLLSKYFKEEYPPLVKFNAQKVFNENKAKEPFICDLKNYFSINNFPFNCYSCKN